MFFSRKFTLGMFQRSVRNFCPKWGEKCPKIKRPKFFGSNVGIFHHVLSEYTNKSNNFINLVFYDIISLHVHACRDTVYSAIVKDRAYFCYCAHILRISDTLISYELCLGYFWAV